MFLGQISSLRLSVRWFSISKPVPMQILEYYDVPPLFMKKKEKLAILPQETKSRLKKIESHIRNNPLDDLSIRQLLVETSRSKSDLIELFRRLYSPKLPVSKAQEVILCMLITGKARNDVWDLLSLIDDPPPRVYVKFFNSCASLPDCQRIWKRVLLRTTRKLVSVPVVAAYLECLARLDMNKARKFLSQLHLEDKRVMDSKWICVILEKTSKENIPSLKEEAMGFGIHRDLFDIWVEKLSKSS